ncbi:MAG TPA: transcription elongation factor GreA [Mycobacteriales bacterium]|nr:transcription elongation factor GreA [Mycobacteriales bacterium]
MTQSSPTATFLTQEAFDRLQAELADLETNKRPEVVARIEAAREEGDLRENGGYHAAKEEQGKLEARIRELTVLLRDAVVGEAPDFDGKAGPGTVLTVRFDGDDEDTTFLLASREAAGGDLDVFSPQSPIGEAVTGHGAGDTVEYKAPNGSGIKVTIVAVEPFHG